MIQGIVQILIDDTDVQTLVGLNKSAGTYKIFPVVCPQGEDLPYSVCSITGADPIECKGLGGQPEGEIFDVLSYADKYAEADAIDREIIKTLNNYSGTSEGVTFSNIFFLTHRDLFDNSRNAYVRLSSFKANLIYT